MRTATRAIGATVRAGACAYDRRRDLPGLIRLDPFRPVPENRDGVEDIVARLRSALRAERNRARASHWTYDLNRHIALRQAYVAESERLAALQRP
jgi:hypothetical protein